MRAVVITKHGGPRVLRVQEFPDPAPGPRDVRIQVAAAGVNFADVMARIGLYPDAPKPPCVVGYELAGTLLEVGDDVRGLVPGQRVFGGTRFGGYATQVVVPAHDVVPLPERLTFEQGAAIPVNYATAWAALIRYGGLQLGERVLLHAAAGGVGIAATQLAKHAGAEVWGTAGAAKHEAIAELGVDHPLDYREPGWDSDLPRFDVIMDSIGGSSHRRSYELLAPGGRLIAFGASALLGGERRNLVRVARTLLRSPRVSVLKQMSESKAVIGLNMLTLWRDHGTLEPWIVPLRELLDGGVIEPVVAGAFPFEEAGEAHRMLSERRNVGKVVLVP